MNKYARQPDEVIDLHGYTTAEAGRLLRELVSDGTHRHVRIITGKGLYRETGPVLRNYVKHYLDSHGIEYMQSKVHDGGEGALEVFL